MCSEAGEQVNLMATAFRTCEEVLSGPYLMYSKVEVWHPHLLILSSGKRQPTDFAHPETDFFVGEG